MLLNYPRSLNNEAKSKFLEKKFNLSHTTNQQDVQPANQRTHRRNELKCGSRKEDRYEWINIDCGFYETNSSRQSTTTTDPKAEKISWNRWYKQWL